MLKPIITLVAFSLFGNMVMATNVQGKIKCVDATAKTEAVRENITVDLLVKDTKEWKVVATTTTGNDGKFSFSNLDKKKKYVLKINEQYYPIVLTPKETQDLPPIMLCP